MCRQWWLPDKRGVKMSIRVAEPRQDAAVPQGQHLNEDSLGLHVLGDLSIYQRSQVEEHLASCSSCRNDLRRLAEVIAVFRTEVCAASA
jgi:hypothetical protein